MSAKEATPANRKPPTHFSTTKSVRIGASAVCKSHFVTCCFVISKHSTATSPCADHDQPDERNGNKDFPAQAHNLVIAITRKSGARPDKDGKKQEDFERQPENAWNKRQKRKRRIPAAEKERCGQR